MDVSKYYFGVRGDVLANSGPIHFTFEKVAFVLRRPPIGTKVTIHSARINGDELLLNIAYPGGFVTDHHFKFFWDGQVIDGQTPRVRLVLRDQVKDVFEEIKRQFVVADLKTIKQILIRAGLPSREFVLDIDGQQTVVYLLKI